VIRRTLTAAAVAAASVALCAAPSDAVWTRPSTAPLTNAAGAANGCTGSIDPFVVGRYGTGALPPKSTQFSLVLSCPASADVHRVTVAISVFEVAADGSETLVVGPGEFGRTSYGDPLDGVTGGSTYLRCPDRGNHTYLGRAIIKTKHSSADTQPYVAKVDRLQTVSCR
jgi:hypothetical protein